MDARRRLDGWQGRLGWVALAAGVVVFQLTFVSEITDSDSTLYLDAAYSLLHPGSLPDRLPMVRPGLTLPLAAVIAVIGVTPLAARLLFALANAGTLLITYYLGERWLGRGVGWMSVALLLVTPQFHLLGNVVLPEGLMVFFGAAALAAWVAAARGSHPFRWAVCSGLSIGGAYLTKVTGLSLLAVLFALVFLAPWRQHPRRWRAMLVAAATVAAVWLIEMGLFAAFTGDPWYRIRATHELRVVHWQTYVAPRWWDGAAAFFAGANSWWRTHVAPLGSYGLLFWFAAAAVAWFAWRRQLLRVAWPLAWLGVLGLLLGAETMAYLDFYPRRFSPTLIPAVLLVALLFHDLRSQLGSHLTAFFAVPLATFGLATIALLSVSPPLRFSVEHRAWDIAASLGAGQTMVASDCRTIGFFRLYDRYRHPERFRDLSRVPVSALPRGAVVVLPDALPPECLLLRRFDLAALTNAAGDWRWRGTVSRGDAAASAAGILRVFQVP